MSLRQRGYLIEEKRCGHCYETAAKYILDHGKSGDVLVHGRPTLQRPPYREFGHAWVERGDLVIDKETTYRGPRAFYYMLGQIDYKKNLVYTPEEVRQFVLAYNHWGPWEGPSGVKITAKNKKAWLAKGKKMPRRTKKSKAAKWITPNMSKAMKKRLQAMEVG